MSRGDQMRFYLKHDDFYWTGFFWTDVIFLAKDYTFNNAYEIIQKRFHRFEEKPRVVEVEIEKKLRKRRKNKQNKVYFSRRDEKLW